MSKRYTEAIAEYGAAILDNGKQITITEILDRLNNVDLSNISGCSNCKDNGKCTFYNSGESDCMDILKGGCKFYNC